MNPTLIELQATEAILVVRRGHIKSSISYLKSGQTKSVKAQEYAMASDYRVNRKELEKQEEEVEEDLALVATAVEQEVKRILVSLGKAYKGFIQHPCRCGQQLNVPADITLWTCGCGARYDVEVKFDMMQNEVPTFTLRN